MGQMQCSFFMGEKKKQKMESAFFHEWCSCSTSPTPLLFITPHTCDALALLVRREGFSEVASVSFCVTRAGGVVPGAQLEHLDASCGQSAALPGPERKPLQPFSPSLSLLSFPLPLTYGRGL